MSKTTDLLRKTQELVQTIVEYEMDHALLPIEWCMKNHTNCELCEEAIGKMESDMEKFEELKKALESVPGAPMEAELGKPHEHQWFEIDKLYKESKNLMEADGLKRVPVKLPYGIKVQCANCYEVRELTGEIKNH